MRRALLPLLLALPLTACGSSTTGPGGLPGTDVGPTTDGGPQDDNPTPVADGSPTADVSLPPTPDGGPGVDVSETFDVSPPTDDNPPPSLDVPVPPPFDAGPPPPFDAGPPPPPFDAGPPPPPFDAGPPPPPVDGGPPPPVDGGGVGSLVGRWRVVAWAYTAPDGGVTHLVDHDTPILDPASGASYPVRVNGILSLGTTRLSLAFGSQASDHFYLNYPPPPASDGPNADYSATGFTIPGLLDDAAGTFTVPGGSTTLHFSRNPDGTIAMAYAGTTDSSRTTFIRVRTPPPPLTALNLLGYVQMRMGVTSAPMAHPRAALLWERPGAGPSIETNSTALSFAFGASAYAVVQTPPLPAGSVGTLDGVSLAVGYTFIYDDVNANGHWDGAPDVPRGLGPVTVVWRGDGTPTADWASSPFADIVPGYQLAHLHQDILPAGWTLAPFDTTHPVSPDVPVSPTAITMPALRLLR